MDAGGLAQMTYNPFNSPGSLGTPGSGFASRGKGAHIKRLSVAPAASMGTISEIEAAGLQTPRTSRSHLLAGLRTAPKTASGVPTSSPYNQVKNGYGQNSCAGSNVPQTATGSHFGALPGQFYNARQQGLCSPDQILAPPSMNIVGGDESMDPQLYNELVATNKYLAQRQQELQQQLINMTQQYQHLSLGGQQMFGQSTSASHVGNGFYNQQLQQGMQPVVQPVPNQPGVYTVFNPMTGQHSFVMDQQAQYAQLSSLSGLPSEFDGSTPQRRDNSSPPQSAPLNNRARQWSPPRQSPSPPQDVAPLPEPSANAFRPGHRKSISSATSGYKLNPVEPLKSAGLPSTPNTGTFGLGMARAGEHPIRQPRGPPPLEELVAKPTASHEGSKNFATRQRRRALANLMRAGNERRGGRSYSGDASTPTSEGELSFSGSSSDGDSDGAGSSSMTTHSSVGSLHNTESGKAQDNSIEKTFAAHAAGLHSAKDEVRKEEPGRRRMPMMVLTSAEKRKHTAA